MKPIILALTLFIFASCQPKNFTPEKGMIEITDSSKNIKLAVGQKVYYQAREHGSVGKRVKMEVENEDVLQISKIQIDHDNPNWENEDGGDAATKTFVLKTIKRGSAQITIKELYRGDLEYEHELNCTVD